MKRTRVIPVAIAALAIPALASAASSRHPDYHEMKKVKYLAHEIYKGAHYLYEKSSSYVGYPDRYEKEALYALHELSTRADKFYRAADRHYRDPYRTERAFENLVYAWYEAKDRFRYLPTYKRFREDFYCLVDAMDDLVHYYGGYSAYDRHYRSGHDRPGYYGRGKHRDGYGYGKGGYYPSRADRAARIAYHLYHVIDDDD